MTLAGQQFPPAEVTYFRDPADTWFAAEVIRRSRWSEELLEPLDPEEADIRVAFLEDVPNVRAEVRPDWLCLLPASAEREPRTVVEAAMATWTSSATHRSEGAPPEAYLVAGYQALCPPHPPCEPGPGMRDSLMEFLVARPGALGRVARESDDGANRLLRLFWRTPQHFADEILRARIQDEGARSALQLVEFLAAAEVDRDSGEFAPLRDEREVLLARLAPIAYFMQPSDFDRAVAIGLDWQDRYAKAYQAHYHAVLQAARDLVTDTDTAVQALPRLEALNRVAVKRNDNPVGADAARRLRNALSALARLPDAADEQSPQTAGVVLGGMPTAIAEARLTSAAVLAALEVHRRRDDRDDRDGGARDRGAPR